MSRSALRLAPLALFVLAACSDIERAGMTGDLTRVAELAEARQGGLPVLSNNELLGLCHTYVSTRSFDRAEACLDEADRRLAIQNGMWTQSSSPGPDPDTGFRFSRDWSLLWILGPRARMDFDLGRFEKAAAEAERVVAASTGNVATLAPWDDDDEGAELAGVAEEARYKALEILGLSRKAMGDDKAALAAAAEVAAIELSGWSTPRAVVEGRQAAEARLLLAGGEPERAYQAMTGGVDAETVLGDLATRASFLNPVGLLITAATGAGYDDIQFYRSFETTFTLHEAEFASGRIDAARAGYDAILAEPRLAGYGEVRRRALHARGRIARADGDLPAAIGYFDRAIELIELQRGSIGDETGRIGFVGASSQVYADMVAAQIEAGNPAEAFAYAERGKSRALVDMLAAKARFGRAPGADALVGAVRETGRATGASRDGTRALAAAGEARDRLRAADPALADLVTVPALSPEALRALIPAGTTVIEYLRAGDDLFAFVATREGAVARKLDAAGLDDAAVGFYLAVSNPDDPSWRSHGAALDRILIRPVQDLVKTAAVAIVPHEVLHYLPWAAIPSGSGQLIDRWRLTVLPSVTALRDIPQATGVGMLAVGDPDLGDPRYALPGARAEAAAVAKIAGGAQTLYGAAATETALRADAPGKRVLHLAMHGRFDPEDPLGSALLMAADGANDGRLTAAEIYDLNLDAELVTLSACRTGLGKINAGDDVVGLIRGFLFAGAEEVLASLWLVDDDATGRLMRDFYANRRGMGDAEALRHAQKALRDGGRRHPFYWAAFQLTGTGS